MLTLNLNTFPIITTERLLLREITKKDAAEIFVLRSDERVMKYIDRPRATSLTDAENWIEMMVKKRNETSGIAWAIALKNEMKLIGNIMLFNIDAANYRAELGYSLMAEYHRRGLMNEAIKAIIKYGFEMMELHSIEACINPANAASADILEKNGFMKEAYFKENYFFDGQFLDSIIYSLITTLK